MFILAGYFIRVLNRTAGGDEVPPVFDEWGELAVTGLQAVLIGVAYALVPTILGGGVVAIGIGLSGDGSLDGLGVAAVLVGGLLWTLLSFVVAYLLPAALVNFARTRSLGAGFAFGTLKPIWLSRSYAVAWGTMLLWRCSAGSWRGTQRRSDPRPDCRSLCRLLRRGCGLLRYRSGVGGSSSRRPHRSRRDAVDQCRY